MELRVLGAHSNESDASRLASLLVDGVLAIDAGAITSSLSFEEQRVVRALVLTHHHFDHLRDVPALGLNNQHRPAIPVFGPQPVLEVLRRHLCNGQVYPDMTRWPSEEEPSLRYETVRPREPFVAAGYDLLALPVPHAVACVGYVVRSPDGHSLFYGGDCGPGVAEVWGEVKAELLLQDVTLPNRMEERARQVGHLTPALLREELVAYLKVRGDLPRVVAVHTDPRFGAELREELAGVSRDLGLPIAVAHDGMRIAL